MKSDGTRLLGQLMKTWVPPGLLHLASRLRGRIRHASAGRTDNPSRPQFKLPRRALADVFPGIEQTVVGLVASQILRRPDMLMPLPELLTLGALCRYLRPARVFEIGTFTGSTTQMLAMNCPDGAEIFTLDLHPDAMAVHRHGLGVGMPRFEPGEAFRGSRHAAKIRQLYGNSAAFDFAPYSGRMDLILVDADHTYDFVRADTEAAFRLLAPGGVIVWDDYLWRPEHSECAGVTRCLDELKETRDVMNIAGTRLAIFAERAHPEAPGLREAAVADEVTAATL